MRQSHKKGTQVECKLLRWLIKLPGSLQVSCGAIAQLGERIVRNDEVVGSIPTSSTILQQPTAVDFEFTSHYVPIQFTTTLSPSLACSMRSFTISIVRADARCCDSGTNCAYMSMVVEMRECRIEACTDFGSTPASIIQVARDVRSGRHVAFFGSIFSVSAAGRRWRRTIF